MTKKFIATILTTMLILCSYAASAEKKTGTVLDNNNITLGICDVEFVKAYVTEEDLHVELKILHKDKDVADRCGFHTVLLDDPFYINFWVRWQDENGDDLDFYQGDWSQETKPLVKEKDGRWAETLLFDVKGWTPDTDTIAATIEFNNPFAQEIFVESSTEKIKIEFK